jgi:branched-chain amino acid transport system substrate-binding protein
MTRNPSWKTPRRWLAAAVVLGIVLAGAASAGASTRAGTDTSGVTKKDITLGITYVDLAKIRDIVNLDIGDFPKMYGAIIDDLNASGGINGRKVVPVFAPVNPVGTAPSQEACVKLTEDSEIFAVTGFFLGDSPLCFLEQHETPVVGGSQTAERLSRAKAPWFTLEAGDQVAGQVVDAFAADGAFKGGKLGIVVDPNSQALYDQVVAPALKEHKVNGTVANITATQGDAVAAEQQAGVIAQRFQSDGINKVLIVGESFLQFGNALSKTSYRPRLMAVSETFFRSFIVNPGSDLSVLKDAIGGNVAVDFNEPGLQKCFKLITKATGYTMQDTVPTGQPDYAQGAEIACRAVGLFSGLAGAAGKNLTVESFGKAAAKGGTFEIPGSGKVTYDKKTKTFNQPVFIYRYDPTTKTDVRDEKPTT